MKNGIVSVGHPRFEKKMRFWERAIIREMKRIVVETTELMVTQMKALAPTGQIDGGNLEGSIKPYFEKGGLRGVIPITPHYAVYVEYGTGIYSSDPSKGRKTPWVWYSEDLERWVWTRGMEPQPFFYPAIELGQKYFKDEMDKLGV